MKLLIDMNLSPRWCEALDEIGVQAVHWSDIGPVTAPDAEIMAYAAAHDFVVLTHDLDFFRSHIGGHQRAEAKRDPIAR